jgi:hypothetical protein
MALGDLIGRLLGSNQTFMPGEQQIAQGGGPPAPFWGQLSQDLSVPASSPSLFGVPILPLLMGVGGAFLNRATADRASRNRATGSGFAAMYNLFNQPIQRQQHEQQRMREIMLQQGWGLPFDPNADVVAAPTTGIPAIPPGDQTSSTDTDFRKAITSGMPVIPSVSPTVPTAPAVLPSKVLFNYGGMPIYANPTPRVSIGDLGLGLNLPPSIAGYKIPMSPQALELAFKGNEQQRLRKYATDMGIPEDTPLPIMMEQVKQNLMAQRMEKGVKLMQGMDTTNADVRWTFQDGVPVPTYSIPSPLSVSTEKQKLEMGGKELDLRQKQLEATAAENLRQADQLKLSKLTDTAKMLGFQKDAALRQNTLLVKELQNPLISPERTKEIQTELVQNRGVLTSIAKQERPVMESLYRLSGQEMPKDAVIDPDVLQLQELGQGYANQIMAMPNIMTFEKYPKPKDPLQLQAYNSSLKEAKRTLDEIIPVIEEVMKDRWLSSVTGIPTTTMTWLNNAYDPAIVDFAIRNWKAGYKPSRFVPSNPNSQAVPSAPTGKYE